MIKATGLGKRLKILSWTKEPGKFYLVSDREDFEEFIFDKLGERRIIEIASSCEIHPGFNKIYYYSESDDKKIITSNLGSNYGGNLLLPTWRENVFVKDVDFFNVRYKGASIEERKKETLDKHLERINKIKLKDITLGNAINGIDYLMDSIRSSY